MASPFDSTHHRANLDALSQALAHRTADRVFRRAMSPELSYGRQFGPIPDDARHAAVLILLYPYQGRLWLPLTLRPRTLPQHGGQICLPGGLIEPGETSQQAALRELNEELGVRQDLHMVGRLSDLYVFVSRFRVTPWIALCEARPPLVPEPGEVEQVLEIPLVELADPAVRERILIERGELRFYAPCFHWRGFGVWGATSMILAELLGVVEQYAPQWMGPVD